MCTYLNSSVLYIFFSKLKQPFSTFIMSILLPHVMKRPFVATLNLKVIYLDSSIYFFFYFVSDNGSVKNKVYVRMLQGFVVSLP